MSDALHWDQASLTWAPQFARDAMSLRIPASLRGHAKEILAKTLPPAIERLSGISTGALLSIEASAAEEIEYDDGSTGVEPGYVVITADRFTEVFDAAELRHRLDLLVTEAVNEGNSWAARDDELTSRFLDELRNAG